MLSSPSRAAEERRDAGCERGGAEREQVVVEVRAFGHKNMGGDAGPSAAPGEAFGRPLAVRVVVAGDDEPRDAGRRREGASEAPESKGGEALALDEILRVVRYLAGLAEEAKKKRPAEPSRTAFEKMVKSVNAIRETTGETRKLVEGLAWPGIVRSSRGKVWAPARSFGPVAGLYSAGRGFAPPGSTKPATRSSPSG